MREREIERELSHKDIGRAKHKDIEREVHGAGKRLRRDREVLVQIFYEFELPPVREIQTQ
jgi:hypothetical protein